MTDRIARMTRMMQRRDLGAIVCGRPSNVLASSGFWPVMGNSVAVVTREGAVGLLVPEDEEQLAHGARAAVLRTFSPASLDRLTSTGEAIRKPLSELTAMLGCTGTALGHDSGELTVPVTYAAQFHFGLGLIDIIRDELDPKILLDVTADLNQVRAILTGSELSSLKLACAGARAGFQSTKAQLRTGIEEKEAGLVLGAAISRCSGGSRSGAFGFCMSGPNSADAYRAYQMPGVRRLQPDDIVLMHTNSFVDGLWTDITRTYVLGPPPPQVRSVYGAIAEAASAAVQAIRPGVQACAVDRAARSVMEQAGFGQEFRHATGHGVGLAAVDHAAHPRIHPKSTDVLEPGMTFNIEPAAYFTGEFGVRQCNVVTVTESGCELLTGFDSTLDDLVLEDI